jgi:hypothetical protein
MTRAGSGVSVRLLLKQVDSASSTALRSLYFPLMGAMTDKLCNTFFPNIFSKLETTMTSYHSYLMVSDNKGGCSVVATDGSGCRPLSTSTLDSFPPCWRSRMEK